MLQKKPNFDLEKERQWKPRSDVNWWWSWSRYRYAHNKSTHIFLSCVIGLAHGEACCCNDMRSSSCFVAWKKKKKKGKKKPVNYIANFLSRAFSQGPSFFTLFFIGALNGKSLPSWHLWWACPPLVIYSFSPATSNVVCTILQKIVWYTRGRDRNILVYKRVVVSLFFFCLFFYDFQFIWRIFLFVCLPGYIWVTPSLPLYLAVFSGDKQVEKKIKKE